MSKIEAIEFSREMPILFNTSMVQAILDGKKTVTRRAIKNQSGKSRDEIQTLKTPYQVGDKLYVRETFADNNGSYIYRADFKSLPNDNSIIRHKKWKPSIHMPKEAARIWLEVKDIYAAQLKDITENEALREGIALYDGCSALESFVSLWNSTIKKSEITNYGWNANPWVWVILFERIDDNGTTILEK